jgi:hypothetical protein
MSDMVASYTFLDRWILKKRQGERKTQKSRVREELGPVAFSGKKRRAEQKSQTTGGRTWQL